VCQYWLSAIEVFRHEGKLEVPLERRRPLGTIVGLEDVQVEARFTARKRQIIIALEGTTFALLLHSVLTRGSFPASSSGLDPFRGSITTAQASRVHYHRAAPAW